MYKNRITYSRCIEKVETSVTKVVNGVELAQFQPATGILFEIELTKVPATAWLYLSTWDIGQYHYWRMVLILTYSRIPRLLH